MQPILSEVLTEPRAHRQKRDSRSCLDGYRQELETLAQQGVSWEDLATWLPVQARESPLHNRYATALLLPIPMGTPA